MVGEGNRPEILQHDVHSVFVQRLCTGYQIRIRKIDPRCQDKFSQYRSSSSSFRSIPRHHQLQASVTSKNVDNNSSTLPLTDINYIRCNQFLRPTKENCFYVYIIIVCFIYIYIYIYIYTFYILFLYFMSRLYIYE